jgi:predicted secreted protein
MADSVPFHGKNAYIYISGVALTGANTWALTINTDSVETTEFGTTWKGNVAGMSSWSGSIGGNQWANKRLLIDATIAQVALPIYIYPDTGDNTNYWSGSAVFTSHAGGGSTTDIVTSGVDFAGNGALTATGWA